MRLIYGNFVLRTHNCIFMRRLMPLLAALLLFACTPDNQDPFFPSTDIPGNDDSGNENLTPEIETDEDGYDGGTSDDVSDDVVGENPDIYWENTDFKTIVNVRYNGSESEVTVSDPAVVYHVSGADVTVELGDISDAEVILEGSTEDGQLKVYGKSAVKVTLSGVSLKSAKSSAFNFQNKGTLFLHLAPDTDNVLCDAADQSDEAFYPEGVSSSDEKRNGCIYAKGNIVLSGSGLLKLDGKKKHGISAKGSVHVRPGVTLAVNDVADNCIKAEGITIDGGYIWAKTSADAGKCLSSDADVDIKGGILKLYTSGGSVYEEDENDTSSPAGIKADADVHITGGEILCVSTGDGGKGINVDGNLTIDGGTVDIATSGGKYVYNAALDLDSSPKGVKADGEIFINGGSLNIQVTGKSDGSEGLESKTKITVNDGEVFVYAYDDAINVGGDNPIGIEINGGKIFAFADNNDGIDSNGKLWVNGGLVIASGSAVPEEGLDCDRSQNFIIAGGLVIGTGGAAIEASSSSTQRSVIYNGINAKTGELVVITDSEGTSVLQYELPRTMSRLALFVSTPDIRSGETYTVYSGGSLEGSTANWNGWFDGGEYTAGSKLGTFTSTAVTTTVGSSNGSGGGPGNGGPGNGGWGPGWWN